VAVEYARGFAQRFAQRCRRNLGTRNVEFLQFLDSGLEKPLAFETIWDTSFGQARRTVLGANSSGLMRRAAALGLRLAESGHLGEWELGLKIPVRLHFDRWLLPRSEWIKVTATSASVTIHTAHRGRIRPLRFWRTNNSWETCAADTIPIIHTDGRRYILVQGTAAEMFRLDGIRRMPPADTDAAISALYGALNLLARYAPIFLPWIGRVLRKIIPVRSVPGKICSGSYEDHPGTVYVSLDWPSVAIAEILVHEATHQYYFLLKHYGAVDDGSGQTFFSPIKGTKRPISMILLAYHAFANVLLFYRLCSQKRIRDAGYCRRNEIRLVHQLKVLEDALVRSKALTPLGEALWRPLAARIW
jgi:HEXXH motif-containing protein